MKISTRGRYAVMAMADIAKQQIDADTSAAVGLSPVVPMLVPPVSLAAVSTRQEIPLPYLEQIFQDLRKAGLVQSVRGPKGGYKLAKPANLTFIGDIISSVDEQVEVTRCAGTNVCLSKNARCLTHDLWAELESQIYSFLNRVSLADVIGGKVTLTGPINLDANTPSIKGDAFGEGIS
ncbi:MAG: Rrf2 family transcriptional regulator [Parvibaculales bacterium]